MSLVREQFGRIGVLMGGYSSEREISLKSGKAVYSALKEAGCDVTALDIVGQDEERISSFLKEAAVDVAFIALHGRLGEDGVIQTILEQLQIPYTGSGPAASRLALNKVLTQGILQRRGVAVPHFLVVKKTEVLSMEMLEQAGLSFPLVIKPSLEGSSVGITIIQAREDLLRAVENARQYGDELLVEQYIRGKELTVGILDEKPLPVIEICPKRIFFDFTAKYEQGMTEYIIPARVPERLGREAQETALKAQRILGCSDFSRVDLILGEDGVPYVLEINTIPGFTATSLLPKAAQAAGINFVQLCLKLLESAYGQKKKKTNTVLIS